MYAGAAKMNNLCLILDANGLQNETWVADTLEIEPIADKWKSFGWQVAAIDGHDMEAITEALEQARKTMDKPFLVLAKTVKGKGVPFMENDNIWHGKTLSDEDYHTAVEALSGQA